MGGCARETPSAQFVNFTGLYNAQVFIIKMNNEIMYVNSRF